MINPTQSYGATGMIPMTENLYKAAARITLLKKMKVNLGINKLMLLFSKGKKAVVEACQNRKFLTLVNHEDLLKRIEHEGY